MHAQSTLHTRIEKRLVHCPFYYMYYVSYISYIYNIYYSYYSYYIYYCIYYLHHKCFCGRARGV
jgi:hypothetical protein